MQNYQKPCTCLKRVGGLTLMRFSLGFSALMSGDCVTDSPFFRRFAACLTAAGFAFSAACVMETTNSRSVRPHNVIKWLWYWAWRPGSSGHSLQARVMTNDGHPIGFRQPFPSMSATSGVSGTHRCGRTPVKGKTERRAERVREKQPLRREKASY